MDRIYHTNKRLHLLALIYALKWMSSIQIASFSTKMLRSSRRLECQKSSKQLHLTSNILISNICVFFWFGSFGENSLLKNRLKCLISHESFRGLCTLKYKADTWFSLSLSLSLIQWRDANSIVLGVFFWQTIFLYCYKHSRRNNGFANRYSVYHRLVTIKANIRKSNDDSKIQK